MKARGEGQRVKVQQEDFLLEREDSHVRGHWQVDPYPLCHQESPATFHWANVGILFSFGAPLFSHL